MNKNLTAFAFTVKKLTGKPDSCTKDIYESYIKEMTTKYKEIQIKQVIYEHDKQQKRLHFHAVLVCPKSFLRKKLNKEGISVHTTLLTNAQGWEAYCEKDIKKSKPKSIPKKLMPIDVRYECEYKPTEADYEDFSKWIDINYPWPPKDEIQSYTDEYIFSDIEL